MSGSPRPSSTDAQSAAYDLAELRDAAEHDGKSATTVYIGGPGWEVVLALVEVAEAALKLSERMIPVPRGRQPRASDAWYAAMDALLAAIEPFENRGDHADE